MKIKIGDSAVSEIVGSILLLGMAIVLMSAVYIQVLSDPGPDPETHATLLGDYEPDELIANQKIIFEHQRGEEVDSDSKVILNIAGSSGEKIEKFINEFPSVTDDWTIGEKLIYTHDKPINDVRIEGKILDKYSNSVIFWGLLQDGYVVPPYGLGGHWQFDEEYLWSGITKDVLDSSENENHGIARSGARHVFESKQTYDSYKGPGDPDAPPDNNGDNVISGIGSSFFNGIGSDIWVENHYSLNIENEITIDAWMKPLKWSYVRETGRFNARFAYNPDVIHVNGDIYAIVGRGKLDETQSTARELMISTVIIKPDGTVEEPAEDSYFSLDKPGFTPSIVRIKEYGNYNIYAIVYTGDTDNRGLLKTVTIDKQTGAIDDLPDKLPQTFAPIGCWPDIVHVKDDIYVVAYSDEPNKGSGGNGYLQTIQIDPDAGTFVTLSKTDPPIDTSCNDLNIIKVNEEIYLVAYTQFISNNNKPGIISTFKIDPNTGLITSTPLDSDNFDINEGYDPDIIHIENNIYAIAYRGVDDFGYLATLSIDLSPGPSYGFITVDTSSNVIFDGDAGFDPDIENIVDDFYGIVYSTGSKGNPDGKITTLTISSDGSTISDIENIVDGFHDPYEHLRDNDFYYCYTPRFIRITDEVFAVVYRHGEPHLGQVSTFRLQDPTSPYQRGIFKSGSVGIYANQEDIFASIVTVDENGENEQQYPLELDFVDFEPDTWYHIALTFDGNTLTLYGAEQGGAVQSTSVPIPGERTLKITNEDFRFGYLFFGYLDEIVIRSQALTESEIFT